MQLLTCAYMHDINVPQSKHPITEWPLVSVQPTVSVGGVSPMWVLGGAWDGPPQDFIRILTLHDVDSSHLVFTIVHLDCLFSSQNKA